MQKYKEINGNDYVKDSRTTINETMQSIQSMNSGTAFPTNNLFEGMKCYRTDLKKTYTLTDVENNTWVEDAHATLSDEATHAASATKLDTARSLNLGGAVTADAATFDGTADATINVKTLDATKLKGTAPVNTTGNAATATKLATPRTLSLTGKASGSATFDGSANASINVTSVNADTASKLSTARKINITGNATGAATFDGSTDIIISTTVNESKHAAAADSATNADTVDGYHENSFLRYRGTTSTNGEDTLWSQIGIKEYDNVLPESLTGTYTYGAVISLPSQNNRLDLWYDCYASDNGTGLYYRTGWANDKHAWARLLDSNNYTKWAPTKTGSGASGTWDISITGSAASATTATNATNAGNADTVDGIHADSMFYNKGDWVAGNWGTIGAYQVNNNSPVSNAYTWGQVISSSTKNARFQLYASDQYGGNGRLHYRTGWDSSEIYPWITILDSENYNLFAPTKTGGGASGTWGINISGNADTVDGYHASDIINRISAANTGGIVAASLTNNGYVKFANGLILQWGNAANPVTFPIAFPTTALNVVTTLQTSGDSGNMSKNRLYVQTLTTTGFSIQNPQGTYRYYAVGY